MGGVVADYQVVSHLSITPVINIFLKNLVQTLSSGVSLGSCYHDLKRTELFIYFRSYYSSFELFGFFRNAISVDYDFRRLVESRYTNVRTIREFADLVCMTLSTFQRKFRREFHIPVGEWLSDRKAERLLYLLKGTSLDLGEISSLLDFASPSHMGTFCRRRWGKSPREIRHEGVEAASFPLLLK